MNPVSNFQLETMKKRDRDSPLAFGRSRTLGPLLEGAGYQVRYVDVCVEDIAALSPVESDLLIVLGGPIGAYQDDLYPTLKDELRLLENRLASQCPTLGICLGRS